MKNEVIWRPLPGSQSLALACPCSIVLLCGTRASAKSDSQLMMFRKHVGKGYGPFWRGLIYDVSYKGLDDLISKSKRWFLAFNDGAKFLTATSMYKWVWPTGEELLFRSGSTEEDYMRDHHGQEYCLAAHEKLITSRGDVPIIDIEIGDRVLTHNGYKKVTKKFNVGVKPCVTASVYTLDGRLRFEQQQSVTHRLLTIEQGWLKPFLGLSQIYQLFDEKNYYSVKAYKFLLYAYLKNLHSFFLQECGGIFSTMFCMLPQNIQVNLFYQLFLKLLSTHLQCSLSKLQHSTIFFRNVLIFFEQLLVNSLAQLERYLDHQQLLKFVLLMQYHLYGLLHVLQSNGYAVSHIILDSKYDCFVDSHLYDVPVHKNRENDLYTAPSQLGVRVPFLQKTLGDEAVLYEHNRLFQFSFQHPYTDIQQNSNLELIEGYVCFRPCGELHCYDIEVEDTNHYITSNGLTNKNSYIGGNEISKNPSSIFHDSLMSCNRSSFTPEKDSPMDLTTGKRKLLPPIPLQVVNTTNPYGPGRVWVKKQYIDPAPYGQVIRNEIEIISPKTKQKKIVTRSQVALFSSYVENIYITEEYIAELHKEKNENKKKAWLYGSWDYTLGGAFSDDWNAATHIIEPFSIPRSWYIDRGFDWGSTHPFSVGWFAEANGEEVRNADGTPYLHRGTPFAPAAGSIILFYEWYGAKEENWGKNIGLGLSSIDVAKGIVEIEKYLFQQKWVNDKIYPGPADNEIGNVRDRASANVAQSMSGYGVEWTKSDKSAGSRTNGFQLFKNRLQASSRGEGAAFYVMRNCRAAIHFIPEFKLSAKYVDDIETTSEEHVWDMLRYRVLSNGFKIATNVPVHHLR